MKNDMKKAGNQAGKAPQQCKNGKCGPASMKSKEDCSGEKNRHESAKHNWQREESKCKR